MHGDWVNTGTDEKPRFEHIHADGSRHKADRTIPFMTDETPRSWRASFVCRHCPDARESRWHADG